MLVDIKRQTFETLEPDALAMACMEPIFVQIRGKNPAVKAQVYAQLTRGQQALLMFRVLYDHARNSADEFYWWFSDLLSQPKTWDAIQAGLQYFGDADLPPLLQEIAGFLVARKNERAALLVDLEQDPELLSVVSQFHARFLQAAQTTLCRITEHIRLNPDQFVSHSHL